MKRRVYKVVPAKNGGWKVGDTYFQTKPEAVAYAIGEARLSQPSQVRIWKKDGKIQTEYTYGNDPRKTRG